MEDLKESQTIRAGILKTQQSGRSVPPVGEGHGTGIEKH